MSHLYLEPKERIAEVAKRYHVSEGWIRERIGTQLVRNTHYIQHDRGAPILILMNAFDKWFRGDETEVDEALIEKLMTK